MSTEIATVQQSGAKGAELQVTQFAGPRDRGLMLQLTQASELPQTNLDSSS